MKERPILFTPAMAAAVYAGRKTQTRRVVKWKYHENAIEGTPVEAVWSDDAHVIGFADNLSGSPVAIAEARNRFGAPGDRLCVRECTGLICDPHGEVHVAYKGDMQAFEIGGPSDSPTDIGERVPIWDKKQDIEWKPNIHMPRDLCRSVVEVVSVYVERVESIRTENAVAEGFDNCTAFLNTFYKINKRAPEGSNPWVWVVEFQKLSANAGAAAPGTPASEQGSERGAS